jgi:hypothetical protein
VTIFGKFVMKRLMFFFFLGGVENFVSKKQGNQFAAEYGIANKNFAKWRHFATKEILWLPVNR